jgi:hypothetical protein
VAAGNEVVRGVDAARFRGTSGLLDWGIVASKGLPHIFGD